MESLAGSAFSHRYDTNGSTIFTLSTCFNAVPTSMLRAAFENAEREHTCNPDMLDHWKMFIEEIKRRDRSLKRGQST